VGRRHHQRRADALGRARRDQDVDRAREAAEERGDREDGNAQEEQLLPAEEVGQLAAGQEQRRVGEEKRVHSPLEPRQVDVEVRLDRGQRDVHDRRVQHHHEEAERDRREGPPAPVRLVDEAHRPTLGR
jgi:hypothetical protein